MEDRIPPMEEVRPQVWMGCDAHRKYSIFVAMDEKGKASAPVRVEHDRAEFRRFLRGIAAGTAVAVEATGSWYWLVDELEEAGLVPHLAQPFAARRMLGYGSKKTDTVDARCLATLLRNGTLPEAWIPPAELRDLRNLMRSRLALREYQTCLKNRLVAVLNRYGLREPEEDYDLFRGVGRYQLSKYLARLSVHTHAASLCELHLVDELETQIQQLELKLKSELRAHPAAKRLATLPGVGVVLSATMYLEIGWIERFPHPSHLASYAGLVPVVHASGGHVFYGPTARRSNRYLRWALVEAANLTALRRKQHPERHVSRLYERLRAAKGHQKAAVAVARHLAEAAWWILKKQQDYREPRSTAVSDSFVPTTGQREGFGLAR
jgi:transposase